MLVVIVYGSLYGIRFPLDLDPRGALQALLRTSGRLSRPGDVLANIVFYLPWGFSWRNPWSACRPGPAS